MLKQLTIVMLVLLTGCASMVPVYTPATPEGRCPWRRQVAEIPMEVAKLIATIQVPSPTLHDGAAVQDHWYRTHSRTYEFCRDTDMPRGKTETGDYVTVTINFAQRNSGWVASEPMMMRIQY